MMSALPSKADMCGARGNVCFGPKADVERGKLLGLTVDRRVTWPASTRTLTSPRRAGIRELHFVRGNGRDDPALIWGAYKIWQRACLDVGINSFCVFVHRVRACIGDRS